MDHNQAVELQLAVKYVLGELPPVQRDEYEDHYIDCPECAKDVYAAASFTDTAREVFREEARGEALAPAPVRERGGWFAWLRPVVAAPALAVLLLAVGYQSFVSVPHWKAQATASRVLPMNSLISSNTRGSDSFTFKVRPREEFGLFVDVPADAAYRAYLARLVDPTGHSEVLPSLSYEEAQKTLVVKVNPGERSGSYQLVVSGLPSPESDPAKATILATMKFTVEFIK